MTIRGTVLLASPFLFWLTLLGSSSGTRAAEISAAQDQHPDVPWTAGVIGHPLNIRKHPMAAFSDPESDGIINDANGYFAQCRAKLSRIGSIADASGIPSVINSQADMNAACNASSMLGAKESIRGTPRRVRVVNAINWCGGPANGGTIIGCAYTPGTCLVVRRWSSFEGQLLAHEFGHSKGLPHRLQLDAVMYPSVGSERTTFNGGECDAIRRIGLMAEGLPMPRVGNIARVPIEEFVTQTYFDGIPYDEAKLYASADAAKIAPWLKDNTKSAHWSNVAATVGIIADKSAYSILNELVNRQHSGKLPIEQYDGRVAAIKSLGFVVKGNGSSSARRFLEQHTTPSAWNSAKWMAPYHASTVERNLDLAAAAVLGLSLAGDPKSERFLEKLSQRLERSTINQESLHRAIQQALIDIRSAHHEQTPK